VLQQRRNAAEAVATVLTGQGNDRLGQTVFIVALCGLVALRPAWLVNQTARVPFTQSFFPSVLNGNATPLGT
jgi:hypothetical protein